MLASDTRPTMAYGYRGNAALTTAVEYVRRALDYWAVEAAYDLVSWRLVETPGPAKPPEKRKVFWWAAYWQLRSARLSFSSVRS